MKKSKKKGFSLIELLAVIVVLAILAFIVVPVIGNLIRLARIRSAVASTYGYIEAANNEIVMKNTRGEDVRNGTYDIEENVIGVQYKGKGPDSGIYTVDKVRVTYGDFCIWGYNVVYQDGKAEYVKDADGKCGTPPPPPPVVVTLDGICKDSTLSLTPGKTYDIKTVEDLYCVAKLASDGEDFTNIKVKMTTNIDFTSNASYKDVTDNTYGDINGDSVVEGIKEELTKGKGFLPIGNETTAFNGTFEGNGKKISNLLINRNDQDYVGLFGYIGSNGKVSLLMLDQINVTGKDNTGGIVGYNTGEVTKSIIRGNITGNDNVGGASGFNNKKIQQIVMNGNVSGANYIGGIVGAASNDCDYHSGIVENGTITASTTNAGKVYGKSNRVSSYDVLYASATLTTSGTATGKNGYEFNGLVESMPLYDDVLDTYIGGDNDGDDFIFDYDSNNKLMIVSASIIPTTSQYNSQVRGNGSQTNPYLLKTEKEFKLATLKLNGLKYFKIDGDIDVSTFKHFYGLGTANNRFQGYILGNHSTISNVNINGGEYAGLVGYFNEGRIEKLNLVNSTINGSRYTATGSIVGYNAVNGDLIAINLNNVTVNGSNNVGGLIGSNWGEITAVNIFDTTVNGKYYVGGFAGNIKSESSIREVSVRATVTADNSNAGGLAGEIYNFNEINNIYIDSTVTADQLAGGYVGTLYTLKKAVVVVAGNTLTATTGGASKAYASLSTSTSGPAEKIYTSSGITVVSPTSGKSDGTSFDSSNANDLSYFATELYNSKPLLESETTTDLNDSGYYFGYDSNNRIVVVEAIEIVPPDPTNPCPDIEQISYVLQIKTVEDLVCLSKMNSNAVVYDNIHIVNDIDFNSNSSYKNPNTTIYGDINGDGITSGIKTEVTTGKGFLPIGTETYPFRGDIEGDDKTISNLYINRPELDYVGLFGYIKSSTANNIIIKDSNITGHDNVGSYAGYLEGILKVSKFVDNTVSGNNNIGSVIGKTYGGEMTTFEASGTVSGQRTIGGVIGWNESPLSEGIISSKVTCDTVCGGVIGYGAFTGFTSGVVKNVLVRRTEITGGADSLRSTSLIYGNLYDVSYVQGAVIESGSTTGMIGNTGYTDYTSTSLPQIFFMNEVTYTEMGGEKNFTLYDKNTSAYETSLDTYIGGDDDDTGYYFRQDENGIFQLVSANDYPLTFNLNGNGTEASPYLIYTVDDWKMATLKVDMVNVHFKLMNNLDFKDVDFYKMGGPNNRFNGTFDGNNKTISHVSLKSGGYTGVFGYLGPRAEIKNLTISDSSITNACRLSGMLAGVSQTNKITNVTIPNTIITTPYGTSVGGFIGYTKNVGISNNSFSNISLSVNNGLYVGGVYGQIETPTDAIENVTLSNISINSSGSYVGGLVGVCNYCTNLSNITMSNIAVYGNNSVGGIVGAGFSKISDVTANKILVDGNEFVGGLSGSGSKQFENINTTCLTLNGLYEVGGLHGQLTTSVTNVNMYNTTFNVTDRFEYEQYSYSNKFFAGISSTNEGESAGINIYGIKMHSNTYKSIEFYALHKTAGNITGVNIDGIDVSMQNGGTGSILYSGNLTEAAIHGNIVSEQSVSPFTVTTLKSVLTNLNMTGKYSVGGLYYSVFEGGNTEAYAIIEGGTITSTNAAAGKVAVYSYRGDDATLVTGPAPVPGKVYVSDAVTVSRDNMAANVASYVDDGIEYSASNANLTYYSGLTYTIEGNTYPMLETATTGDTNNSGFIFTTNSKGDIVVIKVGGSAPNPNIPECPVNGGCTENCGTTHTTGTGTCPTGDVTPPTCVFNFSRPETIGITGSFTCTDDSGAPVMASLFNATTTGNQVIPYSEILEIGSIKDGPVTGNSKTITVTWDIYDRHSVPQPGLCYYYQFGAIDACGNWSSYVTNDCYYGFSGH